MAVAFEPTFCDWVASAFLSTMNAPSSVASDIMVAVMESKPGFIIAQAMQAMKAENKTNLTRIRMTGFHSELCFFGIVRKN